MVSESLIMIPCASAANRGLQSPPGYGYGLRVRAAFNFKLKH